MLGFLSLGLIWFFWINLVFWFNLGFITLEGVVFPSMKHGLRIKIGSFVAACALLLLVVVRAVVAVAPRPLGCSSLVWLRTRLPRVEVRLRPADLLCPPSLARVLLP